MWVIILSLFIGFVFGVLCAALFMTHFYNQIQMGQRQVEKRDGAVEKYWSNAASRNAAQDNPASRKATQDRGEL